MKSSKPKLSRMLILLTAMAVLLPLLAALQYYWLGQVSEGASERLQANLRGSAIGFRHDFNREFIRAYLHFHMDSFGVPNEMDIGRYHAERLEQWNQTVPHPRLISEVLAVNYDDQDQPHLSRLDAQAKRFETVEWSGEFQNWYDRFARRDDGAHLRAPSSAKTSLESFAEDIPALIIPLPPVPSEKQQAPSRPLPPGFTIVKLDLNYIKQEFIPLLIQRDLADDLHADYNVAVVSLEDPKTVIYSSSQTPDVSSSDVATRIFGLEADELRAFIGNEGATSRAFATAQPAGKPVRLINLRFLKRSAVNSATASSEEEGRWQLLIKHRAGSLGTVVNSARRRNLAISFGILLLLGAGILMTAISTRRAERLARQQINFVAGVSHELRTPLAVICSAGENLAHGIVDNPAKVTQYGEVIHREGKRLTDMVEQVLEFAGAQSGRERYDFRPADVAEFIDGAVAACQVQIQEGNFRLEKQIKPDLPLVLGDGAALQRVIQNLIGNAIKYGKNGEAHPWVIIKATTCAENGNEVQIKIEDGGLGINSSDLPHVFEPFFRGQAAVAAQIEGSGVGLSLVKQIVEAHGGRVRVKSSPGSGSVFTLHLPVANHLEVETEA